MFSVCAKQTNFTESKPALARAEKMKTPKLKWSEEMGEGSVVFPLEFDELDWITKMDALKDWRFELDKRYNDLLKEGCGAKKRKAPKP